MPKTPKEIYEEELEKANKREGACGKKAPKYKALPVTYNGVKYKSGLEAHIASQLDVFISPYISEMLHETSPLTTKYEGESFLLKGRAGTILRYRPDFNFYANGILVACLEVKGYWKPQDYTKLRAWFRTKEDQALPELFVIGKSLHSLQMASEFFQEYNRVEKIKRQARKDIQNGQQSYSS